MYTDFLCFPSFCFLPSLFIFPSSPNPFPAPTDCLPFSFHLPSLDTGHILISVLSFISCVLLGQLASLGLKFPLLKWVSYESAYLRGLSKLQQRTRRPQCLVCSKNSTCSLSSLSFHPFISIPRLLHPGAQRVKAVGKITSRLKAETFELGAGTARCLLRMRTRSVRFWFPARGVGCRGKQGFVCPGYPFPARGSGRTSAESRAGSALSEGWRCNFENGGGGRRRGFTGREAGLAAGLRPGDRGGPSGAAGAGNGRAAPRALSL